MHLTDEEVMRIDDQEQDQLRKLTLERMKLQSWERLANRTLERKMIQFKSKQAMKFGKNKAEVPDDEDMQGIWELAQVDPETMKQLTIRASTAKDPTRHRTKSMNAWNQYNDLNQKTLSSLIRPVVLRRDREGCEAI